MSTLYHFGLFQLLILVLVAGCCVLLAYDGFRHFREKRRVERFDRLLEKMESRPRRRRRTVYQARSTPPRKG